jgi:hypothetical protein
MAPAKAAALLAQDAAYDQERSRVLQALEMLAGKK